MAGIWSEASSERFTKFCKYRYATDDVFKLPSIQHLQNTVDLKSFKTMLSIGSGDGRFEISLMQRFAINVDLIEPSATMYAQLVRNLDVLKGPGKYGILFNGRFEDFDMDKRYDFIFASHSFYFLKDPARGVQKALNLLNPGGHLIIQLHVEGGLGNRLINELDVARTHGGLTVELLWERINIPCETSLIESSMPYGELIEGDSLSPRGRDTVSFFGFRDWKTFTDEEIQRARAIIDDYRIGTDIISRTGQMHFQAPAEV
jgi:SAM-dependent methyltransferase